MTTSQLLDKPGPRTLHRFLAALTQRVKETHATVSYPLIQQCGFIRLRWDTGLKYPAEQPIICTSCPINFLCNIDGSGGHFAHASYLHLSLRATRLIVFAADVENAQRRGGHRHRALVLRKAMLAAIAEGERQWKQ